MHLVVEGRVRLSVLSVEGRVLSFSHASRGDIFGEIATLDGQARTADATALTQVTTMTLTRASLWRLMEAKPLLAHAAVAFVCRRLRATSEQIEAIALHSIEMRLARFLLAAIALRGQGEVGHATHRSRSRHVADRAGLLLGASRSQVNEAMDTLARWVRSTARRPLTRRASCRRQDPGADALPRSGRGRKSSRAARRPTPGQLLEARRPDRSRLAAAARRCAPAAASSPCAGRRRACAPGRGAGFRRRSGRRR